MRYVLFAMLCLIVGGAAGYFLRLPSPKEDAVKEISLTDSKPYFPVGSLPTDDAEYEATYGEHIGSTAGTAGTSTIPATFGSYSISCLSPNSTFTIYAH